MTKYVNEIKLYVNIYFDQMFCYKINEKRKTIQA